MKNQILAAARVRSARPSLATLALLAAAATLAHAEPIDERRDAAPDGRVVIRNVSGSVEVVGWDRDEIHVSGDLGRGTERLEFDVDGNQATIEVRLPRRARNVGGTELVVKLPAKSRVEVNTVSADVEVEGVEGRVKIESVSGAIDVSGSPDRVQAKSVSGSIGLDAETDLAELESVSGDVDAHRARGELIAKSVSGDVDVAGDTFTRASLGTVSGTVRFSGSISGDGEFDFESHSGDVLISLAGDVDAELEVTTFSGDIDSEFGERSRRRRHGPGDELFVTLGEGTARVNVSTFSGDVEITRAK